MIRTRLLTLAVLALTALGILGHVCVLPLDAQARTLEAAGRHAHDDAAPSHQDGDHDDGAIHAASCDAVAAPSSPLLAGPSTAATRTAAFELPPDHRAPLAIAPPAPSASPPLYLTHRALLI
jgi:hypothetical protein